MIPTIRDVRIRSRYKNLTKGLFILSKFRFRVSVIHEHRPDEVRETAGSFGGSEPGCGLTSRPPLALGQGRLDFYLDPNADQYGNIMEMAEGFWFVDDRPADR
jgi:hypothetical protein